MSSYINEELFEPLFFNFSTSSGGSGSLIYSSANFYRTALNSNIELLLDLGTTLAPGIFMSADTFLNNNTFNSTKPITEVSFDNNKNVRKNSDIELLHDIMIQFKLTKDNGFNYQNYRELRTTLVDVNGDAYDPSLYYNNQPSTGAHDTIFIKGKLDHTTNDIVKLKFSLIQTDDNADQSSTILTIFRISWNILGSI